MGDLGLSGLGGFSMKLLLVALEMGMEGNFFNDGAGSGAAKREKTHEASQPK